MSNTDQTTFKDVTCPNCKESYWLTWESELQAQNLRYRGALEQIIDFPIDDRKYIPIFKKIAKEALGKIGGEDAK